MSDYPKRLIEVDIPIREISAHARREKSIRHGHISTLHIWWARRPLAACRAVLCAALWPDPADEHCPQAFRDAVALVLAAFAEQVRTDPELARLCASHWTRWVRTNEANMKSNSPAVWPDMRYALLDLIADFANWDASTVPAFLETVRMLTQVAHMALMDPGFQLSTLSSRPDQGSLDERIDRLKAALIDLPRPLVVDPFAGGGSIPLEALRVGADAFASDLNPVAVLLNKVVLEYIPKYGNAEIRFIAPEGAENAGQEIVMRGLAEAVRYWGDWIKKQADKELAKYYPKDSDGVMPIAYLWARTITCEGPGCGVEVPLIRSLWLAKKGDRSVAMQIVPRKNEKSRGVDFEIIEKCKGKWVKQGVPDHEVKNPNFDGTVRRGSATCPVCGYTTPVEHVRAQLKTRNGGAQDSKLYCVVVTYAGAQGRHYRAPTKQDLIAVANASRELENRMLLDVNLVPNDVLPTMSGVFNAPLYGHNTWGSLFNQRQALSITTLVSLVNNLRISPDPNGEISGVIRTVLALAVDRQIDSNSALCTWRSVSEDIGHTFGRQALPMMMDYVEGNILSGSTRDWLNAVEGELKAINSVDHEILTGYAEQASANHHPLPDDIARVLFTDPPYYNAIPYADLSDFFYVWLRRTIGNLYPYLFGKNLSPKEDEICEMAGWDPIRYSYKDKKFYEQEMSRAMAEARRLLAPNGLGVIVFAHKSTSGWEAQLAAMIEAGWTITGSWPIDTEMGSRLRARNSAVLASSIHLVCRPREASDGAVLHSVGDWRDILSELPLRIRAWLPRLANEGVVGADAIFACLGPALEIYSRYSRVEKASGEQVTLKEYLEVVWAAVAREALSVIFEGADATGFEEDARLTAMWLWTLSTKGQVNDDTDAADQGKFDREATDEEETVSSQNQGGYVLEFDVARKIAQGLGAHLERLDSLVEIKGGKARLRLVSERAHDLFGKQEGEILGKRKKKDTEQMSLFNVLDEVGAQEAGWADQYAPSAGATTLDQLHQAMLLFATGRGEALKRFLIENGIGKDQRFWRLAQALSALYPVGRDEKRWVDGVLARKKSLGL